MAKYIDADALSSAMYDAAFETDTDLQRWDSGCWIRYKLFENILKEQPTIDAVVPVVRCKDCKYWIERTLFSGCRYANFSNDPDGYCYKGEHKDGST